MFLEDDQRRRKHPPSTGDRLKLPFTVRQRPMDTVAIPKVAARGGSRAPAKNTRCHSSSRGERPVRDKTSDHSLNIQTKCQSPRLHPRPGSRVLNHVHRSWRFFRGRRVSVSYRPVRNRSRTRSAAHDLNPGPGTGRSPGVILDTAPDSSRRRLLRYRRRFFRRR